MSLTVFGRKVLETTIISFEGSPGIPQSTIIASAAHAVPPVAIKGSSKKTLSRAGEGGSLE